MKKSLWLAATAALIGTVTASAQMPPPPPLPPAPPEGVAVLDGTPNPARREIRRIIIRGDEAGPHGMGFAEHRAARGGAGALGWFMDPRAIEGMTRGLDLTPQQLGKMTEFVATARPEMRKLAEEMAAESRRLQDLSPGDARFAATSTETAKRMGELTGRLVEQSSALRSKVWALLTPEQRTKAEIRAKEMRERIRERIQERRRPD